MAVKKKKEQRSKFYINKRIQGKILWRCAIFWVVYHFLMIHTLMAFEFMMYQIAIFNGGPVISFTDFYSGFLSKYLPLMLTAAAIFPILARDLIKMSHRIVGPLVPFQNAVKKLKNGELVEEVELRDGDLLIEFQNDFNDFLRWYNKNNASNSTAQTPLEDQILSDAQNLQDEVSSSNKAKSAPLRNLDSHPSVPSE
ncbi:hypothetical protein [Thalassoglobus sp.]|uniref:hypothetical protein n=1 Tax=Thalassoglobus sp. TaxID=2795869 RepID=UPI003AA7B950